MKNKFTILTIITIAGVTLLAGNVNAQGFSSIMSKLDELETRLNTLESKDLDLESIQNQISNSPSTDISGLEASVASLENRFSELATNLVAVESEIKDPAASDEVMTLAGDLRDLIGELRSTVGGQASGKSTTITKDEVKNVSQNITPEIKAYSLYHHDGTEGDGRTNSFDISRVYIGAKYKISDKFKARYLTDISHASGGGKFEVFTKYAYLDWNFENYNAVLTIGLQGLQNWKQAESAWKYRVIRHAPAESFGNYWGSVKGGYEDHLSDWALALMDTTGGRIPSTADIVLAGKLLTQEGDFSAAAGSKMGSSADMGIGITVKPSKTSYASFIVRNGTGYKKAENDMYKNFQLRAGSYFLEKALHLSAFVELEPFKGVEETFRNIQWDVFAGYKTKTDLYIGVDVNSKIFAGSFENITSMCYSAFGNYHLRPNIKAFGRYDQYVTGFNDVKLPTGGTALKSNSNLIIFGFDYMPDKHIHIIPNVQIQSFEDPDRDTENGYYIHLEYEL